MPTVSIYLSEKVLSEVQELGEKKGLSVSKVLSMCFRQKVTVVSPAPKSGHNQLDRIEQKLDLLIPKGMPESLKEGRSLPVESIEKTAKVFKEKVETPKGDVKVNDAMKNFMGSGIKPMPKVKWKK